MNIIILIITSNKPEKQYKFKYENKEYIVIDMNSNQAIGCLYEDKEVDCNSGTKVIDLNDYILYKEKTNQD